MMEESVRDSTLIDAEIGAGTPPAPDLETAVALIELGGHPDILAREALAVIDAAGCARAVALVATAPNGPRVIESRGWDEAAALAAARQPTPYDVVPLGEHRDEPWHLVIEPQPELERRCALIAIRKLIGIALTLERSRRDELQHAAAPAADPEVRVRIDQPLPAAVQILEQTMVKSALDRTHGRVEEAAKMLGISRKGLFLKRRRWGLRHQASS